MRRSEAQKAESLERWLADVKSSFGDGVLQVDNATVVEWGRVNAICPLPVNDGQLVATAKVHELTLVTRNVGVVSGLCVEALNPFDARISK